MGDGCSMDGAEVTVFTPLRERARSYPSPPISLYLYSNSIIYRHTVTNQCKGAVTVVKRPSLNVTNHHHVVSNSLEGVVQARIRDTMDGFTSKTTGNHQGRS